MSIPLSFEFFPPNTPEGTAKLRTTRQQLALATPEFFSVTFGAGGSTRDKTLAVVLEIAAEGLAVAPHLSCVGASRESIRELLHVFRANGVRRLVALRGDLPSGMLNAGEFRHASDLVEFIRAESGDWFRIEVAAYPEMHPQSRSPADDLAHFLHKVRCGADSAITQYFYNPDAYFRFRDDVRAQGCAIPIVPGIMPITNYSQLARFSENCGAEIPRWVRNRLASYGDDRESIRAFGLDVVAGLCERLIAGGADALHFYTLNQASPSLEILRRIGQLPSAG
jgi:methylenetetrahydrofolate reductase (NADPH)